MSQPAPTVALFVTCLTDQFYPQVGVAVTRILECLGCTVHFPQSQTCCGQPMFNNGYHTEASALARRFVEIFEPYDYIVTPSGSCCAMVREHFPHLLGGDPAWSGGAKHVAACTYEFVEFLTRVLKVDLSHLNLPSPRSFAYHYTCHLRGLGMTDEAPRLLQQLGGAELRPLEKSDQCCGFGGTFAVKYPQISGAIVQDKVHCLEKTKADTLICNDAGCTMNIAGACHRHGSSVRVQHIAEVIAEAMGIELDRW
jgi:L-lactate dehydrogenase complex protein LldE